MLDLNYKVAQCTICKNEYTSTYFNAIPWFKIYVCKNCMEAAKENFTWVCLNCGSIYSRPKKMIIDRMIGWQVKDILQLSGDIQLFQGIFMCIRCNPDGILSFARSRSSAGGAECASQPQDGEALPINKPAEIK
jgi:hypothetical protein